MADYLMGIDYGTGGAKSCIINTEGKVLAYAFREYPIITKKPRWSEHDPHLYWQIAGEIIKECINQAQIDPREIRGIGTSSALPSMVMVDKNHQPIHQSSSRTYFVINPEINSIIYLIQEMVVLWMPRSRMWE